MKKILVIEDERSLREEISDILHFEGYEVFLAENGIVGEKLAIEKLPDLILCDIMMPGITGTELITHLRLREDTRRIPFIFMSALAERRHLRVGMELGADDYVTKPFTIKEMLRAIQTRLEKNEVNVRYIEAEIEKTRNEIRNRINHIQLMEEQHNEGGIDSPQLSLSGSENDSGVKDIALMEALKSIDSNNTLRNLEKLVNIELSKSGISKEMEMAFNNLRNEIRSKSNLVNNWTVFQMKFNRSYPGFVERLFKQFPHLTPQDLTLASGILINLNTQQLAGLLNITPESLRKSRFRLKRKLSLGKPIHLRVFLNSF
jgi:DNA-binding response OmpR family regulator